MKFDQLLSIIKAVILSPYVIGVTIVIVLYFSVVNYVVYYRKRPPAPKRPKARKPAPVAQKKETEGESDEEAPENEEEPTSKAAPKTPERKKKK